MSKMQISGNVFYVLDHTRQTEKKKKKNRVGAVIFVTFLINIFFLVFYVNIQPSWNNNGIMEYFNIKIRLLIRET